LEVNRLGPRQFRIYHDCIGQPGNPDFERLLDDLDARRLGSLIFGFSPNMLVGRRPLTPRDLSRVGCNYGPSAERLVKLSADFLATALAWLRGRGRHNVGVITIPWISAA